MPSWWANVHGLLIIGFRLCHLRRRTIGPQGTQEVEGIPFRTTLMAFPCERKGLLHHRQGIV